MSNSEIVNEAPNHRSKSGTNGASQRALVTTRLGANKGLTPAGDLPTSRARVSDPVLAWGRRHTAGKPANTGSTAGEGPLQRQLHKPVDGSIFDSLGT